MKTAHGTGELVHGCIMNPTTWMTTKKAQAQSLTPSKPNSRSQFPLKGAHDPQRSSAHFVNRKNAGKRTVFRPTRKQSRHHVTTTILLHRGTSMHIHQNVKMTHALQKQSQKFVGILTHRMPMQVVRKSGRMMAQNSFLWRETKALRSKYAHTRQVQNN